MKEKMIGKSMENFDFIKVIGEGAWAVVYLATNNKDNSQVAIKQVPRIKIKETPKLQELIKTEIKVLRSCKNENVIRFVETFHNDKSIFIATEFCNGGDLQQYLLKKNTLTEDEATTFLKHILNGFKGLHQVGAMHRDFKLANVLLHNGVCKIADLGFAKQMVNNITRTILGTSLTMAPEVLDEKPYGKQADIWSIGVVYYQMIFGKFPYNGRSDNDILNKIKSTRPSYEKIRISQNCRDFIEKCLTVSPKERISWKDIYEHPLISGGKNVNLYGNGNNENIKRNQIFYKDDIQVRKEFQYPELAKLNDLNDVSFHQVRDISQTVNYGKKLEIAQKFKEMTDLIGKYHKQYFDRRNNIMFVFKFVAPYVYNLREIKANHSTSMFIISKKAYLDMKELVNIMIKKVNFLKLPKYWEQFASSKEYANLLEQFKNDLQMIEFQCISYQQDITICSNQIKAEKNLNQISSSNFSGLVNSIIEEYWFLLAEHLGQFHDSKKDDLIRVLEALNYYKSSKKTSVEQFDRMMLSTDFREVEQKIRAQINSIYGF